MSPELHNESRRALRPRRSASTSKPATGRQPQAWFGPKTGPVASLDGGSGRQIQTLCSLVAVIMGQIGADDDQRLRPTPQLAQHMGDVLRGSIPDDERHHLEGCQDSLQERQLHFESVLGRMRSVGLE